VPIAATTTTREMLVLLVKVMRSNGGSPEAFHFDKGEN
jgi:hypothetical protein